MHLDCCCRLRCRRRCFFFAATTVVGGETRRRHDNRARRSSNGAVDAASFPQPPRLADSQDNRATSRYCAHSCRTRSPVETRAQSSCTMRCSDVVSTAGRRRLHHRHHLGLQLFVALLCLASGKSPIIIIIFIDTKLN